MKSFTKVLALGAVLAASSSVAFADSIVGSIGVDAAPGTTTSFTSTYIDFTNSMGTAAGMVNSATGTFDGVPTPVVAVGTPVTLQNLVFGTSGTELLSGANFSFTVLNSVLAASVSVPGSDSITVTGSGIFTETGYSATPGTFILQSSDSGATSLNITGVATAVTPEPNSLVLMGTGLLAAAGMLFARRRNADNLL